MDIRNQPRFGHTTDLTALFSGNKEEQKSYAIGLIFAAVIIIAVFLVWAILLCIFGCFRDKFGFIGGRNLRRDTEPETRVLKNKEDFEDGEEPEIPPRPTKRRCPRPAHVRIWFLIAGSIFVAFSILIVTQGLVKMQTTVNVFQGATLELNEIAVEGLDIVQNGLVVAAAVATEVKDTLNSNLQDATFCPAEPSLEGSEMGQEIKAQAQQAVDKLSLLDDFLDSALVGVEEALRDAEEYTKRAEEAMDGVDLTDWKALCVLIPFSVIPVRSVRTLSPLVSSNCFTHSNALSILFARRS